MNPNGNASTITLSPVGATTTTFKGDIGDTNLAINPLNDNVPYSDASQVANTNISLVLNGPSGGTGTNTLTLAPVSALPNGNEYTGT